MPAKITLPTVGVFDKQFRYRRAAETDIAKTFARVRRAQREAARQQAEGGTVVPLQARGQRGAA